jgi:CRISPR-associated endonuclease/helicase Cas3
MTQVWRDQDRSAGRALIRDIDNRALIIHPDPNETTIPNPYHWESIGLRRTTVLRWYRDIQAEALARGVDWIIKIPDFVEVDESRSDDGRSESAEQRRKLTIVWRRVHRPSTKTQAIRDACSDISSSSIIVVNPQLVQYDAVLGLRLTPGLPGTSADLSPYTPPKSGRRDFGALRRETYAEHIAGLQQDYIANLRERTAAIRQRFEQRLGLEAGLLDRAMRLMFAVHDLGKLDQRWQTWAHAWQRRVSAPDLRNDPRLIVDDAIMLAHTDYDARNPHERKANTHFPYKRPHHAAESAHAGKALIAAMAGDCETLHCALMSAIICHHGPDVTRFTHDAFTPASGAKSAFSEAMRCVNLYDDARLRAAKAKITWGFAAGATLAGDIIDVRRSDELLLYLLLVRVLRLADQGSQENAAP